MHDIVLHEREAEDAREQQRERDRQPEHDQHDDEHDHRDADGARLDVGAPERRDEQCAERQGGDGEPTPRVGSRAREPRMHDELARELDAATAQPTTIRSLIGQTGIVKMPFDAGELARVARRARNPASCRARSSAECRFRATANSTLPRARRDGAAPLERLEEHLDAHQPAVQHCVRELQEHARDERQRHHLGDARDRIVEQPCAP